MAAALRATAQGMFYGVKKVEKPAEAEVEKVEKNFSQIAQCSQSAENNFSQIAQIAQISEKEFSQIAQSSQSAENNFSQSPQSPQSAENPEEPRSKIDS